MREALDEAWQRCEVKRSNESEISKAGPGEGKWPPIQQRANNAHEERGRGDLEVRTPARKELTAANQFSSRVSARPIDVYGGGV